MTEFYSSQSGSFPQNLQVSAIKSMTAYSEAKTNFLLYAEHQAGLSRTTLTTYKSWLNRYEAWLTQHGYRDADIDAAMKMTNLQGYLYDLSGSKMKDGGKRKPRTIRSAFHPIRALGEYLVVCKLYPENPAKVIKLPKKGAATRLIMSDAEAKGLIDSVDRLTDIREQALARALIATLLLTGMRACELLNMKVADVAFDRREVLIPSGKGDKSRVIFPSADFFAAISVWLEERQQMGCTHDWVWAQDISRRISDDWMRKFLERIKGIAGYKHAPNIKPHSMRHWFATKLYRETGNIKVVQQALGHSDTHTTYIYLHVDEDDCRAMANLGLGFSESKATHDNGHSNTLGAQNDTVPAPQASEPRDTFHRKDRGERHIVRRRRIAR